MARAKRHYIPGQIWHITHRCHQREFLLKFTKDRKRMLQWFFEAKKRYGLVILNYTITSNHIHLLVADDTGRKTIPDSIKLIAGRIAQEYNQRKNRKGAFWEDRYHATAIQSGKHLMQCIVYIDLNMIRAGVVSHPSDWPFGGYSEIQRPKRKNILINGDRLTHLLGFDCYDDVQSNHKKWVESCLKRRANDRDEKWTQAIAVGGRAFIEDIKKALGHSAKGRRRIGGGDSCQLREPIAPYVAHYGVKKPDMGGQNTFIWR